MQEVKNEEKNKLLIDGSLPFEIRIALVNEQNQILEYNTLKSGNSIVGNIYIGIIDRIEQSIEAAFVIFGEENGNTQSGFLSFADIHPSYYQTKRRQRPKIHQLLKKGQPLIVQVTREPSGRKNANLTTYIALTSKNCILFPKDSGNSGISRRISGDNRKRLREFLSTLDPDMSLIIRTASHSATIKEIQNDHDKLIKQWRQIEQVATTKKTPSMIFQEDMLLKTLRGYSKHLISTVHVENKTVWKKINEYLNKGMIQFPNIAIKHNVFSTIEKQIQTLFERQIILPSGGAIVIEQTEALTTIDINSKQSLKERTMEETAFKTNLEAAEECIKQILLRNIGGLIVIDFIDMEDEENTKKINKFMKQGFKNDKASVDIIGCSQFGLMQISRQRINTNILQKNFEKCSTCGYGHILNTSTQAIMLLRNIKKNHKKKKMTVFTSHEILQEILNNFHSAIDLGTIQWQIVQNTDEKHNTVELQA